MKSSRKQKIWTRNKEKKEKENYGDGRIRSQADNSHEGKEVSRTVRVHSVATVLHLGRSSVFCLRVAIG